MGTEDAFFIGTRIIHRGTRHCELPTGPRQDFSRTTAADAFPAIASQNRGMPRQPFQTANRYPASSGKTGFPNIQLPRRCVVYRNKSTGPWSWLG